MEIYNKISTELYNDNTERHTYQLHRERGYRIVIRHLHSTTERQWIHDQLTAQGYTPRFIRVMQHRYKGRPMKLFEVELQPTMDGKNQSILKLERLGNQNVSVEKQRPKMDPVQCHSNLVHVKCAGYSGLVADAVAQRTGLSWTYDRDQPIFDSGIVPHSYNPVGPTNYVCYSNSIDGCGYPHCGRCADGHS
ncbi:hypothetical protein ACLKA7_007746 [Drosophila subpalustris]